MKTLTFNQDSEVGSIVFSAFVKRGIVGPPYGLSGVEIYLYIYNGYINVSFYDMSMTITSDMPEYNQLMRVIAENFTIH